MYSLKVFRQVRFNLQGSTKVFNLDNSTTFQIVNSIFYNYFMQIYYIFIPKGLNYKKKRILRNYVDI